ncbi:UNVERIFIED_CONTAM: hypothetical protein FKN15_031014 [Acipenser sinensis]
MDAGLMLYNNLKDVKWSTTSLPLDRLVSSYRLPQIVKLDTEVVGHGGSRVAYLAVLHAAVSYTLPRLCDCTWSRLDTRPSDLGAYAPGAHAFSASAPSVSQCLVASVLRHPRCSRASMPRCFGAFGA